jgi:hypothetical protein
LSPVHVTAPANWWTNPFPREPNIVHCVREAQPRQISSSLLAQGFPHRRPQIFHCFTASDLPTCHSTDDYLEIRNQNSLETTFGFCDSCFSWRILWCILKCIVMCSCSISKTFISSVLLPSSESNNKPRKQPWKHGHWRFPGSAFLWNAFGLPWNWVTSDIERQERSGGALCESKPPPLPEECCLLRYKWAVWLIKNRRFRGTSSLLIRGNQNHFTLKIKAICSYETSVLTRATRRRHIPEDRILHYYNRENIRSYIVILCGEANNRHISRSNGWSTVLPSL